VIGGRDPGDHQQNINTTLRGDRGSNPQHVQRSHCPSALARDILCLGVLGGLGYLPLSLSSAHMPILRKVSVFSPLSWTGIQKAVAFNASSPCRSAGEKEQPGWCSQEGRYTAGIQVP
jgi:hypothetical protein